jgi:hypothetical protein
MKTLHVFALSVVLAVCATVTLSLTGCPGDNASGSGATTTQGATTQTDTQKIAAGVQKAANDIAMAIPFANAAIDYLQQSGKISQAEATNLTNLVAKSSSADAQLQNDSAAVLKNGTGTAALYADGQVFLKSVQVLQNQGVLALKSQEAQEYFNGAIAIAQGAIGTLQNFVSSQAPVSTSNSAPASAT